MKIKFKRIYVLVIKSFLEFTIELWATQPAEGAGEAIKQQISQQHSLTFQMEQPDEDLEFNNFLE